MPNRRDFLRQTIVLAAALASQCVRHTAHAGNPPSASKSLRILILGGTGFLGTQIVRAAVTRGHAVSVFNRGKTPADLPQEVEHLIGDRNDDLKSLSDRNWDAVIDVSAHVPRWIRSLGESLRGRVGHYTFISTVLVYDRSATKGRLEEQSAVLAYSGDADPYSLTIPTPEQAAALKALCEREAETQFPRTLVIRPGHIVGPADKTGYFAYWPARMAMGGEMLVAGEPATPTQIIDVRDVAEWNIRAIEQGETGIFNVTGPAAPLNLGELIKVTRKIVLASTETRWVSSSWLAMQQNKERWNNVLFWSPNGAAEIMRMSIGKALEKGLTFRPLPISVADTFSWYQSLPSERRLALLLSNASCTKHSIGHCSEDASWQTYLQQEKDLLLAWRAYQERRTNQHD